ncbi:energy-coupling factor ABC transporter ATP-binding protein [uncultured Clostridium sp.]|uniref:energy-coupling factor ABC transporter ATP-binding protein n=1 Tax=uncultured Clostridium sp. TaxID=59620 RepID=UPI0025F60808|nr:ABC transporter ATP-binding protein [uncultured Clostridium sp.]
MINIENLNYCYEDGKKALENIDLKIKEGETIGLLGGNGAGKSTLIKLLVGILQPSSGKIEVDNIETNKKNLKEIRKKVGVVFQNSDNQLFMNKVYDDIAFGPRNNKMDESDIKKKIFDISKKLEIENLLDKSPNNLSGGEKRKVSIGTVLVMEPSYILFDEPTSFLDPKGKRLFIETIKHINTAKIIATHDLDMVKKICSRVIILNAGRIVYNGSVEEALSDKEKLEIWSLA